MAALPNFEDVQENEYYEIRPDVIPMSRHPCPKLRGFKIMMISRTMMDRNRRCCMCKWPSMKSLRCFFIGKKSVLPNFDEECTLKLQDASLLVVRRIDPIKLCFDYGRSPSSWLDKKRVAILNAPICADEIGYMNELERTHITLDQLYEINCTALPKNLQDEIGPFSRIALVSGFSDDLNDTVDVRIPSTEALDAFLSSESIGFLPDFNRVFTISRASGSLFLTRVFPIELCYRLRKRRDLWIVSDVDTAYGNEYEYMHGVERTHIRPDQLYEINFNALPKRLRQQKFFGFSRIAWVSGIAEDPNDGHPTVEVRAPSMKSLETFMSSESLGFPDFDRVLRVSCATARSYQMRVLPVELCFQRRRCRDFWITAD